MGCLEDAGIQASVINASHAGMEIEDNITELEASRTDSQTSLRHPVPNVNYRSAAYQKDYFQEQVIKLDSREAIKVEQAEERKSVGLDCTARGAKRDLSRN